MRQSRFVMLILTGFLASSDAVGMAGELRVQTLSRSRGATVAPATHGVPAGAPGDSPKNINHAVWTHAKSEATAVDSRPPIHLLGGTRDAVIERPHGVVERPQTNAVRVQPVGGYSRYPFGYLGAPGRYPAGTPYYTYGPPARLVAPVPRQYGAAIGSNAVVPSDPNGLGAPTDGTGVVSPLAGPVGVAVGASPLGFPAYGPMHVLPFGYGWNGYGWGGYGAYPGALYGMPAYGAAGYAGWNYGPWINTAPIGVPYYYQYSW